MDTNCPRRQLGGGGGAFSVKIFYAMLGYLITTSRRERELSSSPEL